MNLKYADRMEQVKGLETREIITFIGKPDIITFAGGLPAPEVFPVEELKKITVKVLEKYGPSALQYVPTDGFIPLREKIEWGYIIPYAIAGMMNEHPRAAMALRKSDKKENYREFYESLLSTGTE